MAVVDCTEIKITTSSNREIENEKYSIKKRIHSVNVLIVVVLNGQCIYVSDAHPVSHDQKQWNLLGLRKHFEDIPVGIVDNLDKIRLAYSKLATGKLLGPIRSERELETYLI